MDSETVTLGPDEIAALFDAPASVGYEMFPAGKVLPKAFVEARLALKAGRSEMTLREVSTLLGVSKCTPEMWRARGILEGRFGVVNRKRHIIVTIDALVRMMRTRGYTAPVRETAEQTHARGVRERDTLARKIGD